MGRALADSDASLPQFSDPTAFTLLPDDARQRVERVRSGAKPMGMVEAVKHGYLRRQAKVMVARTVAIDDAVREAASPQLVILGAGLDGRAWRLPELADVTVFEVDHPDSQRDKRARTGLLTQTASEVRFVPVDFARDDLDTALAGAGHDRARPTTWIWEGVVMYLEQRDIEATLDVVARRSAPGSRLVILYHCPALMLSIVGVVVRRLGEPLRSSFRPEAMRAMLAKHGFEVVRDQSLPEIGRAMSPALGEATSVTKHLRIVTATRTG
ncbi:MAG: Transcriptional regulator, MerR family protein [Labilithrix sp.]|nr:Transcriptional regulator, MerR family protein [Labilithrix sp.]